MAALLSLASRHKQPLLTETVFTDRFMQNRGNVLYGVDTACLNAFNFWLKE
jgi:hypothetical protein